MGEKDFLVDAVAQLLQTAAWQEVITQFFATHCAAFPLESADEKQSKGVGYTLDQYAVFTQFKELMERQLETMVAELGCSGEDLLKILEESVRNGLTGERRFLIKTLLSFEDYEDFYERITEYAAQHQQQQHDEMDHAAIGERSEWEMQLAVAQSLLDAHAQGLLDEGEQSFLPWAQALVEMGHSNVAQVEESHAGSESKDDPPIEVSNTADEQLKALEHTLIKERLKVDLLVAQRIAEANAAMRKDMLHLSAAEVLLSEEQEVISSEQTLESLFTQLETVRDRLKTVKTNCFEFKNVTQEAMDKIYLFLKEKIHYKQDLVSQEKEISDFIFTLIDQTDAALIPLLLEWLLLESEALRMQRQIQDELGESVPEATENTGDDGFWTQSWDENAQAFFYFHSITGESVWEPPNVGFYDANQEYQWPDSSQSVSSDAKDVQQDTSEPPYASDPTSSLNQATYALEEKITENISQNPEEMFEMERVLERISREHDEERKRLELVFDIEKARQKEELRRRKEKKRREKHLRKKKKEERGQQDTDELKDGEEKTYDELAETIIPDRAPTTALEVLTSRRAEAKEKEGRDSHLSISVPGRGRLDLAHLLSEEHAKRQLEKNGLTVPLAPAPQALLNPTSLRYLAESLVKKQVGGLIDESPQSAREQPRVDIVLEEADEK